MAMPPNIPEMFSIESEEEKAIKEKILLEAEEILAEKQRLQDLEDAEYEATRDWEIQDFNSDLEVAKEEIENEIVARTIESILSYDGEWNVVQLEGIIYDKDCFVKDGISVKTYKSKSFCIIIDEDQNQPCPVRIEKNITNKQYKSLRDAGEKYSLVKTNRKLLEVLNRI